jgi:hypothetical protein
MGFSPFRIYDHGGAVVDSKSNFFKAFSGVCNRYHALFLECLSPASGFSLDILSSSNFWLDHALLSVHAISPTAAFQI